MYEKGLLMEGGTRMVYAIRSNNPVLTKKPLKMHRTQSNTAKEINEFMHNHKVSVRTDATGQIVVKATRINND